MEDYFFSFVLFFFPLLIVVLMFALAQYQKMKKRVKDYIRLVVEEAYREGREDMERDAMGRDDMNREAMEREMTGEELEEEEEMVAELYDKEDWKYKDGWYYPPCYEDWDEEDEEEEEFDSDEFFQEVYEDALQHMDSVVHHPKHYNQYGEIEVVDIIIEATKNMQGDEGYVFGNILKYLLRAPFKGKFEEDVAKANWYWKYYKNGGKENLNE